VERRGFAIRLDLRSLRPRYSGRPRAPINDEYFAEFTDHDIVGFQVAVNHSPGMREGDSVAHFAKHFEATLNRQLSKPFESAIMISFSVRPRTNFIV
jgi:hypothetical protein